MKRALFLPIFFALAWGHLLAQSPGGEPVMISPTSGKFINAHGSMIGPGNGLGTNGLTITSTTGTLTVANGKKLTASNTLTFVGTDGSTLIIGTGGTLGTGAYAAAYVLPTATTVALGGVKVDGTTITITGGVISATPYTLPAATTGTLGGVKVDGTTITITGGVISASGGSTTWVTKTANYNLVAGDHIAADSTGGTFTLTLPSATGSGAQIDIVDPQGSWATTNVTVAGTVNGITNMTLDLAGSTVRLIDVGGTAGWRAN